MARQSFTTLQQETPGNLGIAPSAFPLLGGGITLLILGTILGWLVVRDSAKRIALWANRISPTMPDPHDRNQPHFTYSRKE
ncbi:MAG TPA: hypothetical protein DCZ55_10235, partial [Cyanobacteria bacterium UBA11371]|nr:hypothetical protein [Cyanobacteria bacterium UBA11371]